MNTNNLIKLKDERTGRYYAMKFYNNDTKEHAFKALQERMDYDYFESLPAEQRIKKQITSLDFTCPFCIEKTEIISRKEKVSSGFLFFFTTNFIDIFKCKKCNNDFFSDKLDYKIEEIRRINNVITNFENWKDAKKNGKNPPEFHSLDKVDELIISDFKDLP